MCLDTPHAPKKVRNSFIIGGIDNMEAIEFPSLQEKLFGQNYVVASKLADMVKDGLNCLRKEWIDMREHPAMNMNGAGRPLRGQFTRATAAHSLS